MTRPYGMDRVTMAHAMGWSVNANYARSGLITWRLTHPTLGPDDRIVVWPNGDWSHYRSDGVVWDSSATRVRPQHFGPYLRRLVREANHG